MMHPAVEATLGELLGKIVEYGKEQGRFNFVLVLDEAGDYSASFEFGREADDSPMMGGASYGSGSSAVEAMKEVARECRLIGE